MTSQIAAANVLELVRPIHSADLRGIVAKRRGHEDADLARRRAHSLFLRVAALDLDRLTTLGTLARAGFDASITVHSLAAATNPPRQRHPVRSKNRYRYPPRRFRIV